MSRNCLFALVLLLGLAQSAEAEPGRVPTHASFTASEHAMIERNAALRDIVGTDPGLVRRALDIIAGVENGAASRQSADHPNQSTAKRDDRDFPADIDRLQNPDLYKAQRASPEALNDLFQLIKQAGSAKPKALPR